jgi:hypothetical protein
MYSCHDIPKIPAVRNTEFERKLIVEKFSDLPEVPTSIDLSMLITSEVAQ